MSETLNKILSLYGFKDALDNQTVINVEDLARGAQELKLLPSHIQDHLPPKVLEKLRKEHLSDRELAVILRWVAREAGALVFSSRKEVRPTGGTPKTLYTYQLKV
tara:strand:+ start:259 stop:573 length:315 start_codon:yes stop_codon:yes gene_type:complete